MAQTPEKSLTTLTKFLDNSIENFTKDVPGVQQQIFRRVQLLLRDLDLRKGSVKASVANLRKINRIKREIEQIILSDKYLGEVEAFTDAFNKTTDLQTDYFKLLKKDFTTPKFIDTLRQASIANTRAALTESGIRANVVDKAADIIQRNISESASFGDLVEDMRVFLTKTEESVGALQRHTSQIVTDSLNTYAREYNTVVADTLNSQWFLYVGGIVQGSRDFCIALVKKKWIHKSEFSQITKGNIDVDNDGDTEKVSLDGLKPNTTATSFQTLAGGWSCNHVVAPINEEFVPKKLRARFD